MKLFEHQDFNQLVIQTRNHLGHSGITEQLVEKDYFVTELLRVVAATLPKEVIFKGGTSLSKAWGLIHRFSEDVDLFVDPNKFTPPLGKNAIDRELKKLRNRVGEHSAFTHVEGKPSGGFGRNDHFQYPQRFGGIAAIRDTVLLESGTASGREPVVQVQIESYVARYLRENNLDLGADDQSSFLMPVMHFRRTFVEKLFTIHAKVEIFKRDGRPVGTYARHYYDLAILLEQAEVREMLKRQEYEAIKLDYKAVSQAFFPRDYFEPKDMSFSHSDALFPPEDLRAVLETEYQTQCGNLCYSPFPSFSDVLHRFTQVRDQL
jgi:hypothetical protein